MGSHKHKIGILLLAFVILGAGLWAVKSNSETVETIPAVDNKILEKKNINSLSIGFVGDITPFPAGEKQNSSNPFVSLFEILSVPDIMAGNLEGVITEETISKCKPESKHCFAFKGDKDFVQYLTDAGFDVFNMANNHAFDYGPVGFKNTQDVLREKELFSTGAPNQIAIIERNGTKVAFVGFAPNAGTNSLISINNIKENITNAKNQADVVIAIIHAGGEGKNYVHVKEGDEIYLNENRGDAILAAHTMVDFGADAVLGSGPHLLRGVENYKGKIIAYSLGNFFGAGKLSTKDNLKFSGILYLEFDKSGEILSSDFVSIILDGYGTPHLDPELKSIDILNSLSREDFKERAFTF